MPEKFLGVLLTRTRPSMLFLIGKGSILMNLIQRRIDALNYSFGSSNCCFLSVVV